MSQVNALRASLDGLVDVFDPSSRLPFDPLGLVREQPREEWEVAAHIAAPLAYGSIPLLRRAIAKVFETLGPSPTTALCELRPGELRDRMPGFVYRMTRAEDLDQYFCALGSLLREFGTLEAAFVSVSANTAGDAHMRLGPYVALLRERMPDEPRRGARYLTPDPRTGSAAKRWHLMLRWLCRPDDGADLGLWTAIPTSDLILPLDTHTSRLSWWLGLSDRKSIDYKMAREATDALARLDPVDPLKYDMPLCHLGIAGDCRHRYVEEVCSACALRGHCRFTLALQPDIPMTPT
ncbi:MAG: hypothetical protein ACI81R_000471 [Bradymonadia bacterium]|jgi:uncharacterized protein (TIGR02757 family)